MSAPDPVLAHVRAICLAFPEAAERETWGHPTFRVRDKIFASYGWDESDPPRPVVTMKAGVGEQQSLLASRHPFFRPKYVGSKGWIGVILEPATDWSEIEELVEESYRVIAPNRLIADLDAPGPA